MRALVLLPALVFFAAAGCRTPDAVPDAVPEVVAPEAAEPVPSAPELRLRFRVGDVARYRSLAETDMQVQVGARRVGAHSSEEVEVTHRVVGLTPEGNGTVEVTIESSALACEIPGFKKVYSLDTRKPETVAAWKELCRTDPRAHMLAPLVERVGMRIRITVRPDGTIADERIVQRSASSHPDADDHIGIPYVLQLLGSVDPLPAGIAEVGLAGPFDQVYDGPAGLHRTMGTRVVTAWDPATGTATVATVAKILFYAPLPEGGGRCEEPGCPGMPPGFRFQDWSVRAEETLDLSRGVRLRSVSNHTVTAVAEASAPGGAAPSMTMEMKVTVEALP